LKRWLRESCKPVRGSGREKKLDKHEAQSMSKKSRGRSRNS
jgi:hypothetical protein